MQKLNELVTIKSSKEGLEFWFAADVSYGELYDALQEKLNVNKSFYNGTSMPANVYGRRFSGMQKRELAALIREALEIASVRFSDEEDILASQKPEKTKKRENPSPETEPKEESEPLHKLPEGVFLYRTIRNGQRIEAEGDVTIVGDVNAGAEIVAGGNIAIFGKLRGLVHAGARGRQDVVIAANHLMPQQVRIGGKIAIIPQDRLLEGPEVVKIVDGKIVVDLIG